jgi:hypothetical protein
MPALALLLALHWPRVRRLALLATLALCGLWLLAVAGLSLGLQRAAAARDWYPAAHWTLLGLGLALAGAGLLARRLTRDTVHASALVCLLSLSSLLEPLAGPAGRFGPAAQTALAGRAVAVPVDFVAKEEGYRFLLPGARLHGYREQPGQGLDEVLAQLPLAVVRLRPGAAACTDCRLLGERFDLRGRHGAGEIRAMLAGRLFDNLLVREVIVEAGGGPPSSSADPAAEAGSAWDGQS